MDLSTDLRAFFDGFVADFARFDGAPIARRYGLPYLSIDAEGGATLLPTRTRITEYFQGVLDEYRARGVQRCRIDRFEALPLGGRSALVTVDWSLLDGADGPVSGWRESYTLVRTADGWRIAVSTDHAPTG